MSQMWLCFFSNKGMFVCVISTIPNLMGETVWERAWRKHNGWISARMHYFLDSIKQTQYWQSCSPYVTEGAEKIHTDIPHHFT